MYKRGTHLTSLSGSPFASARSVTPEDLLQSTSPTAQKFLRSAGLSRKPAGPARLRLQEAPCTPPPIRPGPISGTAFLSELPMLAVLTLLAAYTRLAGIAKPNGIVFDELHFGKFVMWQMNHWF